MLRSFDNFGGGAGEGLAAVCGHQSGVKGIRAAMPVFSPGVQSNRIIRFRFPAPTPFSFRSQQAATLPMWRSLGDRPTVVAREDARPPVAAVTR